VVSNEFPESAFLVLALAVPDLLRPPKDVLAPIPISRLKELIYSL
jgi:hypothetical protein